MKHSKHSISLLLVTGGLVVLVLSLLIGLSSAQAVDVSLPTFPALTAMPTMPGLTAMPTSLPAYKLTDLGTLEGGNTYAVAINDVGQVVGYSMLQDGTTRHAFLWQDGVMTDLGTLGGTDSNAYDINNLGYVVGSSHDDNGYLHAFAWHNGTMTDLGSLAGARGSSWAYDITENGWVVGTSLVDVQSGRDHAVVWSPDGEIIDLNDQLPDDRTWELLSATVSNDMGQYVVTACFLTDTGCDPNQKGTYILQDGMLTRLAADVKDINDAGQVVGSFTTDSGIVHAFVWQDGVLTDLGTLDNNYSNANAINREGLVVGNSITQHGPPTHHAIVWHKGVLTDLNDLIPSSSGWVLEYARDVNNVGQIAGYGTIGGQQHSFLYTPLLRPSTRPTPAASILLPAGLYQETDWRIAYSGSWTAALSSYASGGAYTSTRDPAATVTFAFTGTGLVLYRQTASGCGPMEVCIDGTCETVENYSASQLWQQPWTESGLTTGSHAVTIRNLSASIIFLDAIRVE